MMRKTYILLFTSMLFCAKLFASDPVALANKIPAHPFDAVGPVISYTLLTKSSCLTNRTFTATITDVDGVNTIPGTRPRVYYRRSSEANIWISNLSVANGWKYVEATNTSSPFSFTINYSLLWGGAGVSSGQIIEYFVVAQDLVAPPNISINSGSFALAPFSVALTVAAFPIGGAINSYSIVNDLGNYLTIGPSGDFNALTTGGGLFTAINNVGISQNLTVEILDPLVTENNFFPLNQIQNTGCNSLPVSLLIKPATGVSATITGSRANEPIIRILSSNVTIDGSNNGTSSRDLTLRNTNVTNPGVILYGSTGTIPTNNSTLKNTICNNGTSTASSVMVSDGAGGGIAGYFNNITILNNKIQKGLIGLQCVAVSMAGNGSMLINGNDINASSPNQIGLLGIYTEGVDGAVISNNNIGNFESAQPGPRYGIQMVANTINSRVSRNTISGINYNGGGAYQTSGIYIAPAVAAGNNTITDNIIRNIKSTGTGTAYGINVATASGDIIIKKNNISNIKSTNVLGSAYGIGLSSALTAANISVINNFIYDVAGAGSATLAKNGYGIYLGSGGGYKLYYNSVAMNTNQPNAAGTTAALMINGVSTASSLDILNNIFANTQSAGAPAATRYAIYSSFSNTVFSAIDYNDYYSTGPNLGFIGSNWSNLAALQAGFGGNLNSLSVQPDFVAGPSGTDLHLTTTGNPQLLSGLPIAGITNDIDLETRSITTTTLGADEIVACAGSNTVYFSNLTGTTYQWQVDIGSGFINIADGAVYGGTATNTLTLTAPLTSYNTYKYMCVVDGSNFSNVYTYRVGVIWTGAISTIWSVAGNWNCGVVPDQYTDVQVNSGVTNYPVVGSSNASVRSLKVSSGANVTVNSGFTITLTGN